MHNAEATGRAEAPLDRLRRRIADSSAKAGIIGLGYVGLPLARAAAAGGFATLGFDIDPAKPAMVNAGKSYIDAVDSADLAALVRDGRLSATGDFDRLAECDVVVLCVPTPLTRYREPDLGFVEASTREVAARLRPGQLVVLESTTWPGTTREVVKPILEAGGLKSGVDFFVGFSPEREDPGNPSFTTAAIPKIVSGDGAAALAVTEAFYARIVSKVVPVSSTDVAEAAKITENVFRAVNIALVNELKTVFDAMGIDVWEVIEAAKTKPFGYMPFYPGPGLGGHCIPIDPFYLTWKSREYGVPTRFIELAGEINHDMPRYVIGKLEEALDRFRSLSLGSSHILVVGMAYKKNVADIRESPALRIIELLERRGARVDYLDPFVPEVPPTREHAALAGRRSIDPARQPFASFSAVLICTDHDSIDYEAIARSAALVVDTRNAFGRRDIHGPTIVKA